MARRHFGEAVEPRREIGVLAGLDQAEMPLRQHQRLVARDRAEHRDAERLERSAISARWRSLPSLLSTTPPTRTAGSNAAKPAATAAADCDWPETSSTSSTGRRERAARSEAAPGAARRARHAVEQAHRAFDHQQIGVAAACPRSARRSGRRHRPAVEIEALGAGRGGMERRIDVVGTGLRRPHRDALPPQRAEQAERDRVLPELERGAETIRPRRVTAPPRCRHEAAAVARAPDDVADHDEPRQRKAKLVMRARATPAEVGDDDAAVRGWSPTTITAAGVSAPARRASARRRCARVAHRHVEDDRLAGPRQRRPVEIRRRHGRWRR